MRDFWAYVRTLEIMTPFKYLVRSMTELDNDCPTVMGNLRKSQKSWTHLERILGREGSSLRVSGMFFKAVMQAVLIFGSETWVFVFSSGHRN